MKEPPQIIAALKTLDANPSRLPAMKEPSKDDDVIELNLPTVICITPDRSGGFRWDTAGTVITALMEWFDAVNNGGIGITGWLPESPGGIADGPRPKWFCSACRATIYTAEKPSECIIGGQCRHGPGTKIGKSKRFLPMA